MTTPVVAGIGLGSTLVGGLLSGIGKKQSAESQSQMYDYQSRIAKINSDLDKQNADYAINKGEMQATTEGMKAAQQFGAIKTTQAASGFDVNTGSNKDVQDSQRRITGINLDTIRANASKVAYDYNVKSVEDLNQAGLYDKASVNASKAGNMELAASLISTAGSVSSKWIDAKRTGMFNGGDS